MIAQVPGVIRRPSTNGPLVSRHSYASVARADTAASPVPVMTTKTPNDIAELLLGKLGTDAYRYWTFEISQGALLCITFRPKVFTGLLDITPLLSCFLEQLTGVSYQDDEGEEDSPRIVIQGAIRGVLGVIVQATFVLGDPEEHHDMSLSSATTGSIA